MDFMERREPYRNKLLTLGCFLMVLLLVRLSIQSEVVPSILLAQNDPYLSHAAGMVYYKGIPFTGFVYDKYPNGTLAKQTPYIDGRQDGVMKAWYPNKALQQERFFDEGKKQGIHKGWWPDGTPQFEYSFKDDEYNGAVKEWYQNGRPFRVFHYNMGHEEGLEQMWWDNGATRANYVVKDGQQYGLIGRKLCRNVSK
jgi:antitoxin component YwqK of YwqJK toxin-antitoxin module